jgi:hypothetical protein
VPLSTDTEVGPSSQVTIADAAASAEGFGIGEHNTLDEPVWETVKRDIVRIWRNLVMVVFPFQDRSQQSAALRNWDLWGPMVFTLTLAITLSIGAAKPSSTFSLVFAMLSVGAVVLTFNVVLLGGTIGFFQSMCLLGYCLFPLDMAAILCLFVKSAIVRWIVVPITIAWASWASVPFIGGAVPTKRRALAVYPLCLLYVIVGWLAIVTR